LDGKVRYSNVEDKKYVYIIPSYERFDKVIELIEDIMKVDPKCLIFLLNDGSNDTNYNLFKNYDTRLIYLENEINLGKKGYWETVNKLFKEVSGYEFTYCVMLNDDLTLTYDFKNKLDLNSSKKKILRLFTPTTLIDKQNWGFENWIDGIFCAPKFFLNSINYTIDKINIPNKVFVSSGVGRQLTEKINKLKIKVDFVGSMVEHIGNEDSKMHPILRKKEPLISDIKNLKLEIKESPKELPKENEKVIPIKSTIEISKKTINYEAVNNTFQKNQRVNTQRPNPSINNKFNRNNTMVIKSFQKKR
jgi:hypothetical protein